MRIIFFGSDPWMSPGVLAALERAGHEILLEVTKENFKTKEDIKKERLQREIATAPHRPPAGEAGRLAMTKKPDAIVLAAFGPPFLPEDILDWPKYGCLNVHASLLPRWRGASPVFAAIKNGDKKTGVTIMKMTKTVDRGQILGQREIDILIDDNRETLTKKLGVLGGELIVDTLKKLENDQIKFVKQPEKSPTIYTRKLTKQDGLIDRSKSPIEIERLIRAVTPWPGAHAKFKTSEIIIRRAHLADKKLIIDEVQIPGKNPITWKQFLTGHSDARLF